MAVMREGRVFEKVGVNVSTVYGRLDARAQRSLTARKRDPRARRRPAVLGSGISLVAHMRSPLTPAVHMNTRMFWTPHGAWFGGGADLNPMIEDAADTAFFHAVLQGRLRPARPRLLPAVQGMGRRVFPDPPLERAARGRRHLLRRPRDRRLGGGLRLRPRRRRGVPRRLPADHRAAHARPWTEDEREIQLVKRGRYAEFNLVYDRGTKFGLETGHNPEAVLMSLPPVAKWP